MSQADKPLMDYDTHQPVRTGGVLALGNFDGVHLGHREVVRVARKEAQAHGLETHVLTFDPHPYLMFQRHGGPFLLTPPLVKKRLLLAAGADYVTTLHFTKEFAAKTPDEFIRDVLIDGCGVRHVVVGFDFVFGRGRGGTREALRRALAPMEIGVTEVPPYRDGSGDVISSSRIRSALRAGTPSVAQTLLGRAFSIEGAVLHGDQRGRKLGFPTANLSLGELVRPAFGVYAVKARRAGETLWRDGVANIGIRPSIGGHKEFLEAHLFDFDEDIYGQTWEVALYHYLRPEKVFISLEMLKEQMAMDSDAARRWLSQKEKGS